MVKPQFKRLEYLYLIALGCIALSIIISQILIQGSIANQQDDARVINVAGRQRMLSQKISKLALKIQQQRPSADRSSRELRDALGLWERSHEGLIHGDSVLGLSGKNSRRILIMFEDIDPHYRAMLLSASALIDTLGDPNPDQHVATILKHEDHFLQGMDRIVFQYDDEARAKIFQLKDTELYLLLISLLIITLELLFVFRPLARNVRLAVMDLQASEKSSKEMASELSKLYEELGKSYQDLEAVNIKPASPSVYARMDFNGQFIHIGAEFMRLMEYSKDTFPKNIEALLSAGGYPSGFLADLLELLKKGKNWSGEIKLITESGDFVWLEAFLIPVKPTRQAKLIASDITEFKEAKIRSRELNRERIEKSVKEQNFRSSLILEGQEEERKRLAREIHDGVGQMLSAMKLILESLMPSSKHMQLRLDDAKDLMKSIIQEVRRVSFNLTPTSLDDFGLVAAVAKFCEEIDKVTKADVRFQNDTKFINRLENFKETNLYRIIQEAVNNSLKYSKAQRIIVKFLHTANSLNIIIEDDGKGFDYDGINRSGHFEKAGHGIFNMRERAAYIGASFKLESFPDQGTKIHVNLSLDDYD